jgi:hypothetical protein
MDGPYSKPARPWAVLTLLIATVGCGKPSWWPIRPFGSVQTYTQTVLPTPEGHPRGRMVTPVAPGVDIVRRGGSLDPAARPASVE